MTSQLELTLFLLKLIKTLDANSGLKYKFDLVVKNSILPLNAGQQDGEHPPLFLTNPVSGEWTDSMKHKSRQKTRLPVDGTRSYEISTVLD